MNKEHSDVTLKKLRNEIPMASVIHALNLPWRRDDKTLRFICPKCHGLDTSIHPKVNLGRCFTSAKNFNTIDMVMAAKNMKFRTTIEWLEALEKLLNSSDGQRVLAVQARRTMLK